MMAATITSRRIARHFPAAPRWALLIDVRWRGPRNMSFAAIIGGRGRGRIIAAGDDHPVLLELLMMLLMLILLGQMAVRNMTTDTC